jgi:hypothetical protein
MMNIYYNDGVNPSECVHTCSTLKDAKEWIIRELKEFTMVDDEHPCSDDVYESSHTAKYEVYDGDPIIIKEDGETESFDPVYESCYFYTE